MSALKLASVGCAFLFTAGCADWNASLSAPAGVRPSDFGNAVSQNIAAETVNPMAPSDRGLLSNDAQRAALQLQRYLNDMVKEPANIGTGVTFGGGTGSNSSGATGGTAGTGAAVAPAVQ